MNTHTLTERERERERERESIAEVVQVFWFSSRIGKSGFISDVIRYVIWTQDVSAYVNYICLIKIKKIAFGNKEHTKSQKSETGYTSRLSVVCAQTCATRHNTSYSRVK